MIARGGFAPEAGDGLGGDARTVVMVGNAGADMWEAFCAGRRDEPDPMNCWTRRVLDAVARDLDAQPRYPFDGPPWLPFQRWAQRAEPVFPSPVGMLIHPDHGLWHAWRGALVFDVPVSGIPERDGRRSPCLDCVARGRA